MCYADDLGHCSEVQQLTSAVDRLVFYEAARRLVIITRSLLMTQLQVACHRTTTQNDILHDTTFLRMSQLYRKHENTLRSAALR